jgi:hypothetical protein
MHTTKNRAAACGALTLVSARTESVLATKVDQDVRRRVILKLIHGGLTSARPVLRCRWLHDTASGRLQVQWLSRP